MKSMTTPAGLLVSGTLIAAAVVAAYLLGGQSVGEVMSGVGDERTRHLYVRSVAFAGSVMSVVLPGWWLVTVALGEPNTTLSLLCAIFALSWIAAVVVLPRRG
jgi:hypothetical protein